MSDPFGLNFIQPNPSVGVFLERCEDQANPQYQVCGKTKCYACDRWCWLGSETLKIVSGGHAVPICSPCGRAAYPEGTQPPRYLGVVEDRPR